ncbi:hypothetical protein RND81_03G030700 [Saponaria officinalis]|uniref:Uncharacterized protein n=1 Tax=Saponaria officinalis TaxID=3572 RepID=A0AAW1M271_SAPOF
MVKLRVKGPSSLKPVDSKRKSTSSQSPSTRSRTALNASHEEKVCTVVKKHKVEKVDVVTVLTFFEISTSEKFKLSEDDVCDVFGLPNGGWDLELVLTGLGSSSATDVDSLKSLWRKKYGIAGNKDPIPLSAVWKKLTECRESGDEFKRTFVLFSMSSFLAPTSGSVVDFRLVSAIEDVSMINQLNWCKFVFTELVAGVREAVRGARYVRGCVVLLAITYFHRYVVSYDKVSNELPLIQHWNDSRFIERLKREHASGGLGHGVRSDTIFPISRENPCGSAEGAEGAGRSSKAFPDDRFILVKLPADIRTDEEVKSASLDVRILNYCCYCCVIVLLVRYVLLNCYSDVILFLFNLIGYP